MNPLISIIVPIYNVEPYVDKCISSIINQTYSNLQILLIDDGSTDQSGIICDKYEKFDSRIKVIHQKNKGLVQARKTGLGNAKGQYIGFVDGDDYIEVVMYEKLLKQLLEDDSDFIHSMYMKEVGKQSNIKGNISKNVILIADETKKVDFIRKYVLDDMGKETIVPSIWSKLFKADFIKECYSLVPNEQSYGEDWICFMESIMRAEKISFTNSAYYHYIVREGSISHEDSHKCFLNEIHLYHYLLKCISYYKNEELESLMFDFLRRRLIQLIEITASEKTFIPRFYWEDMSLLNGRKIILYGAGKVGKDYYVQICKYDSCEIVCWVDENAEKISYDYAKVYNPKEIKKCLFDYILIAVNDEDVANVICERLETDGVHKEKIIWKKPLRY